jgi:hypothetical protein
MAANVRQKIIVMPINAATEQTIKDYLLQGYVLHQMINLQPAVNSLLIVYYDPSVDD